ncbi:conserved hypothetical protein, partial [Ricinus communis]
FEQRLEREDALDARHRADVLELQADGFHRNDDACLTGERGDGGEHRRAERRQQRTRHARADLAQREQQARHVVRPGDELQRDRNARAQAIDHPVARRHQHADARGQQRAVDEVRALRDLAVLACLAQAFLGWLFGFVVAHGCSLLCTVMCWRSVGWARQRLCSQGEAPGTNTKQGKTARSGRRQVRFRATRFGCSTSLAVPA